MALASQLCVLLAVWVSASLAYSIWPQPAEFTRGTVQLGLLPSSLKITTTSSSSLLKSAIARYQNIIFPFPATQAPPNLPLLSVLTITVGTTNEELQLGVNENYTLVVTGTGAAIDAQTVFGAIRGLESFSQLVDYNYTTKFYTMSETPISVNDYPRFPWRGIMIDTGRHYLQVPTIITLLDAMAYNKFNTLHWHVTDSQSFPIISETYPKLAEAGAYAFPEATYSHDDIIAIVQYGYERGIRIVPEFDIPGHSYTWGLGYPNLTINCAAEIPTWGVNGVTLDPTSDYTYQFLDNFVGEFKPLFMDNYMHFGGDEVLLQCWNNSVVLAWMKSHDIPTFEALEQYFEDQLAKITTAHQVSRVFWEDAFADNGVEFDQETSIIEVWWDLQHLVQTVQAGYRSILTKGFYLDVQQPGPTVHYEWVDTWQDFYSNEPFSGAAANFTEAQRALVLGGEACMWGEAVEDENIFSRVFVRSSGAAEKLWAPYNFTINPDFDAAQTRLIEFRCRLKQRGIHATPIRPDYCPTPFPFKKN